MTHSSGKIAAVVSSLALLGAYVCYQAGAFQLPGSKAGDVRPVAGAASGPATQSTRPSPTRLPGSKSLRGVITAPVDNGRLLPGSKSSLVSSPSLQAALSKGELPQAPPVDRRTLMLGSKSAAIFEPSAAELEKAASNPFTLDAPATRPPAPQQPTTRRTLLPGSK